MKKLVIFGVGLIGGSVALALKQKKSAPICIGIDRNQTNLNHALSLNIIDDIKSDMATALTGADIVLIAAPVAQTKPILEKIKPHLDKKTIITDVGSTKSSVLTVAKSVLGQQANQFIGGHPIAGSEKTGARAAIANLYKNKHVVLTPAPENHPDDIEKVRSLWAGCGANVIKMKAKKHDSIFAAISHLPHLLAFALVESLVSHDNAAELFKFAASGFRDFTRITGGSPEMWRDISLANKAALLTEITAYETVITQLKQSLASNDSQALEAVFERASQARNQWAASKIEKK